MQAAPCRTAFFCRCSVVKQNSQKVTCRKKNTSMHNKHPQRIFTRRTTLSGATFAEFCITAQRGVARHGAAFAGDAALDQYVG